MNKKYPHKDTPDKDKHKSIILEKYDSVIPILKESAKSTKDNEMKVPENQEINEPDIVKSSSKEVHKKNDSTEASNNILTTKNRKID